MRLIPCLCLYLMTLGLAVAQTPPKEEPQLRFRAVSCLGANPVDLYYNPKDSQYTLITTIPERRSTAFDIYYRTEEIDIFRKGTDPKTKKDVFNQVGRVDIRGKGHIPLLLFSPDSTTPLGFNIRVMKDDADSIPPEYYHFVNLTSRPLLVSLNKVPNTVPAGGGLICPPPAQNENANIAVGVMHDGNAKLLYSNIWGRNSRTRTLVLMYISPSPESVFKTIRIIDYPDKWKPQAK
jgi:hypothetical protein